MLRREESLISTPRRMSGSDSPVRGKSSDSFDLSKVTIAAAILTAPPLGASNWPLVIPLVTPVLIVLFLLAFLFGRNSCQRITNMVFGVVGSYAAAIALGRVADIPGNKWLLEGNTCLFVASTTATLGAAIGIAIAVLVRWILSLLTRKPALSGPGDSSEGEGLTGKD